MAERIQLTNIPPADPELTQLLRDVPNATEDDLREQRISFAYGNAPAAATGITKASVRLAADHIRLLE
ncbi:MAG: hypothetical protein ACRD04_05390 [Terriglobales bacterium]